MSSFWKLLSFFITAVALIWLLTLYFIPAFQGRIAVSSGFEIAGISIHYYGILMALAILACFFISMKTAARFNIDPVHVESVLPWLVIFGFLGARLYFVVFAWDHFQDRLLDIPQIWKGGFSIYGGIIGAVVGLVLYTRKKNLPVMNFLDLIALSAPLAQAIGRLGNFFNSEAFGYPTSAAWKLYIAPASRPKNYLTEKFFHPTFLYELLWNLLVFFILWKLFKAMTPTSPPPHEGEEGRRSGQLFGIYLILYSIGRFFIEGLRLDSFMAGAIRVDQVAALLMCAAGLGIMYYTREKQTI